MPFKDPERAKAYEAIRREEHNAYKRAHYAANPEAARAKDKAWRVANPEKVKASRDAHRDERRAYNKAYDAEHRGERDAWKKAYMKEYREVHREEIRTSAAAYRTTHPRDREEASAAATAYYFAHHEEQKAKRAAYRAAHPEEFRARRRLHYATNRAYYIENVARRRATMAGAGCVHPACLAVGPIRLAWQTNPHRCWMCDTPVFMGKGGNLHMDHVVPIAGGGLHCADNLRPACAPCNRRKGAKVPAHVSGSSVGTGPTPDP